jgi:voltage-gated sodium channel
MIAWSRRIANDQGFQNFILGVIVVNAVLVGLETSEALQASYGQLFEWLNTLIQAIFVIEIAVRLLAYWPRLFNFFRDGWNVFDFAIVAAALMPAGGNFATVARLARLLRVVRLISVFPELRLIVGTMLRSVGSMGHVILLLSLVIYVYAVLGYHLFHEQDPEHWGTLGLAVLTLFQVLTLEGWVELQEIGLRINPSVWIFYGTYVLIAVFIVVNLFIAVVINNLETVKAEHQAAEERASSHGDLLHRIEQLKAELSDLEQVLRRL